MGRNPNDDIRFLELTFLTLPGRGIPRPEGRDIAVPEHAALAGHDDIEAACRTIPPRAGTHTALQDATGHTRRSSGMTATPRISIMASGCHSAVVPMPAIAG